MTLADGTRLTEALGSSGVQVAAGDHAARYGIDGASPNAVAHPSDLQELSRVMEVADEENVAVTPWGGGTRTALGNTLDRLDLVVDMSRLDHVLDHNPADLTATVQAGITLAKLQEALGEHGQFLALDPPLPDRATVGGTLAAGLSGPMKWQYGSPRDVVIGMKVVQADGKVTKSGGRVVKNVSGYDMAKLHIGGLGTLGIIAEVSLRLTPLPAGQATVVAAVETARQAMEAGLAVFHSDVMPLALSAGDSIAVQPAALSANGDYAVAVRLGGRPRSLDRQIDECRSIFRRHNPTQVEVIRDEAAAGVWRSLADFGFEKDRASVMFGRCSVQPSAVPELVESLKHLAGDDTLRPTIVAHPAHGTVLVRWLPDGPLPHADDAARLLRRTRDGVHRFGGRMIIEKCPPEVKPQLDVWDDLGEPVATMRRLKKQYDPRRTLNPGRFAGGI